MGGMITATVLAVFYIPLFFVVVLRIFKPKQPDQTSAESKISNQS